MPEFNDLPVELHANVLSYLDRVSFRHATNTCFYLNQLRDNSYQLFPASLSLYNVYNKKYGSNSIYAHNQKIAQLHIISSNNIASCSYDNHIDIITSDGSQIIKKLTGHNDWVLSLAVLPNGKLVSGSMDATIRIWDIETGEQERVLTGHIGGVVSLAILHSGDIVSGGHDGTIRIWDSISGKSKHSLRIHNDLVSSIAVLPNGNLVSGSWDKQVCIYDTEGSNLIHKIGRLIGIGKIAVLPSDDIAITTGGVIRIFDSNNFVQKGMLFGHAHDIVSLAVFSNGDIVSSSFDRTVRIWDSFTCKEKQQFTFDSPALCLAINKQQDIICGQQNGELVRLAAKSIEPHTSMFRP